MKTKRMSDLEVVVKSDNTDWSKLTDDIENKLDEADVFSVSTESRLTHEEIFQSIRNAIHEI